jgi:hypothetical protein
MSRALKRAGVLGLAVVLLYGLLLAFPEPLFAHRIQEGSFLIYSREPFPRALAAPQVRRAEARLERSEIHRAGATHRVFITGSAGLYRLVNGPYYDAIARNVELGNAIFLPRIDREAARVVHFDGRSAPLDAILAHEATHTLVQDRIGLARAIRLPFWKKEGYAEYVALDFFPLASGVSALRTEAASPSLPGGHPVPRRYLEAAVIWAHRMSIAGESFDEVIASNRSFRELLEEALGAATEAP